MATSIVTQAALYPPKQEMAYSHGPLPSSHSLSSIMSPSDPLRRVSDDVKSYAPSPPPPRPPPPTQKQSLPSIHEALAESSPPPGSLRHQPSPTSFVPPPASLARYASDPVAYLSNHTQTPQRSPPQPIHPSAPSAIPRPDPITPSFNDGLRHSSTSSVSSRSAGPAAAQYPPAYDQPRYETDQRQPERMDVTNGYNPQMPPQQRTYDYPTQAKPPNMYPPQYHPGYHGDATARAQDVDAVNGRRWPVVKRHLDIFDLEISLADINSSSKTLVDFSTHFHRITQESQRNAPPPERMPSLGDIQNMIGHADRVAAALNHIKEKLLEQQQINDDYTARLQNGKASSEDYSDDVNMYGSEEMKNPNFGVTDGKKRRGRAAPPGRCHSCNRAETPEWRRGPDGARTLCNACGLHYAKLTRKLGTKNQAQAQGSSTTLRPKSAEGSMRPS